jgi:arginine N-succinyltransferase
VFLIRRAKVEDVATLYKLARMVHFINLPADKDLISEKVLRSRQSFMKLGKPGGDGAAAKKTSKGAKPGRADRPEAGGGSASMTQRSDLFMFVLEEREPGGEGGVLGTSQLISSMGGPGAPNVSLKLAKREMFSTSLQQGVTHITAKLALDESGPTEIGGLILQPSYRGHKEKLGRFLSHVRFHFIALHRQMFSDRILAEMMGAITHQGEGGGNTLWEYLGRRFINLTYLEADRFCQHSKEFITALMPREEIYLTLLPPEARGVIAQVGPETLPARRMLEKLGFAYRDHVDPFDGGPHLEAKTDDLLPVRETITASLGGATAAEACRHRGIVSVLDDESTEGEFRAVQTVYDVREKGAGGTGGAVWLPREAIEALEAKPGMMVGATPFAAFEGVKAVDGAASGTTSNGRKKSEKAAKRGSKR